MNHMAFPKKKWLTSKELKDAVEKKQTKSSKKERVALLNKCIQLWSKLIRIRDNHRCQWCGSPKGEHAHHIVTRSACSILGMLNLDNGMTLCFHCHITRIKDNFEAYLLFRDSWLRARKLTYDQLEKMCTVQVKMSFSDLSDKLKEFTAMVKKKEAA